MQIQIYTNTDVAFGENQALHLYSRTLKTKIPTCLT